MKRTFLPFLLINLLLIGCAKTDSVIPETVDESEIHLEDSATAEVDRDIASDIDDLTDIDDLDTALDDTYVEDTSNDDISEIEDEDQKKTALIVMVGDVLLHDRIEEGAYIDGEYDFSSLFSNVKETIESADLAIVNEEVIIGGEELGVSGYPAFNAPFEIADELVSTGFDVICHGTNHALDKGKSGVLRSIDYWEQNYPDIEVLGVHDSAEDQREVSIIEVNDITIAILNYTYGTNGIALPDDMPYLVDMLNEERVTSDLKEANDKADFVIVCPHWGTEYRLELDSNQEYWTKVFFDNGADLVLGTHPHVIEPIEMIGSDEENTAENNMLVYYSIGNFVNWTSGTGEGVSNRMLGGMAKVWITKENEKTYISDYGVDALVSHVQSGKGKVTTYFLRDYSEELAEENEIKLQDEEFSYEYLIELSNNIWGNIWE